MKPPIQYIYHGDRSICKRLELAHSRRIAGILETIMVTGNQQQNLLRFVPYDGALMVAREFFGTRIVDIYAESGGGVEPSEITYDLVKIFVHVDMLNHEDWSSGTVNKVAWYDSLVREDVVSAVACGIVALSTGQVMWKAVKEPYSATYDCNLLAEHSGTDWEGVYSLLDTAGNANTVLNYYNTLFSDSFLYEATLPTISSKWIKTKSAAGAIVSGTENYAVTAVLTAGYTEAYTQEDGTLLDWTKYVYSNNAISVWLTPPNMIVYSLMDRYDVYPFYWATYTTSATKMPFIRYRELLDDGVTYDARKYTQGVQLLIRHDWHGGGSYASTRVEVIDYDHRYYRMRLCPIVGYTWCLPDEQQVSYVWGEAFDGYSQLYATSREGYIVRGLHRTMPTYSTVINRYPYRGSQMTPQNNHLQFENGNVYEQNYELPDGFSWYIATAGGNISHQNYVWDYTYFNPNVDLSGDYTLTETVRGLYSICALAGYNLPKWGERHADPINKAIKEIASAAITYLGGTVYDNATIPLDIPVTDTTIIEDVLGFPTIDYKQSPGLLYCSPLFNIRVNCVPVKQKLIISQPGG